MRIFNAGNFHGDLVHIFSPRIPRRGPGAREHNVFKGGYDARTTMTIKQVKLTSVVVVIVVVVIFQQNSQCHAAL